VAIAKPARPLYGEFLARVIQIDAVQRERATVSDEHTAEFFSSGRRPGVWGDFEWSLDNPEAFPGGPIAPMTPIAPSPAMKRAWDAAVIAWRAFINALVNGELIANGVHPASGVRSDLDPAEWTRAGLILDVRNGDLFSKERGGKLTERWTSIVLRAAIPERKLGRIDWNDWWEHEKARRQQNQLPNDKSYLREAEPLIKERYGVSLVPESELRRIKAALYRGDLERPKRKPKPTSKRKRKPKPKGKAKPKQKSKPNQKSKRRG
jgi:hypothetical protein